MTRKEIEANCPVGYSVYAGGPPVNMLGAKELWRIFENHSEPHLSRLPQDFVGVAGSRSSIHVPKEWGHCLYYKVV